MKFTKIDDQGKSAGSMDAPNQFSEAYRPDLIHRAVVALQSAKRQKYGASPDAGKRSSSELSKRRRKYRGCYGKGIGRVNRKIHSRRGSQMHWVGAFSPQTVGGRRAHAPKSEKDLVKQINNKENRKAIRSAMAATVISDLVKKRGHTVPDQYPVAVADSFEQLKKTDDVSAVLHALGYGPDLARCLIKKVRAGRGTMRGRKYKRKKGLLIVVSQACPAISAARNIPGVDILPVNALNAELLAPGALPGRLAIWTESALKKIKEDNLFQ